jgi:hypothetical protein
MGVLRAPVGPLLLLLFSLVVPRVLATNVTLAWDPSSDPTVVGYNLYCGDASHSYTNLLDAGNATAATWSNLVPGVTYYFAATTYTLAGLESDFSTETSFTVPAVNPGNTAPTLDAINNLTVTENSGAQTVSLTGIGTGAANEVQTLTVTASSSNPSLIANPTVTYTSPNSTGSLRFSPAVNGNGSAVISVTVIDGGTTNNTVVRTFTVTVSPINVAPKLDPIADLTIEENSGPQTVNLTGIGSGATNEIQTLTVTAISSDPSLIATPTVTYTNSESTGSLTLSPATNGYGSAVISVTVDDGSVSNNTVVRTFTVTVNPIRLPPTLDAIAAVTVNENSGSHTVNLTGISAGSPDVSPFITVNALSSNPALVPNPTVAYTSPNSTGSLSFSPAANTSGSVTITVLVDNGAVSNNTVLRSFTVTVNAVNQPPTLDTIANLTINENSGAQTVSLAGIGTGAANETQTMTITASSSNPGLIPNPTVIYTSPNATGSLSLTPATDGAGSAVISVTVDDGGTSDSIVVRTFTVTVNPVNQPPTLEALGNLTINENSGLQTVNLSGIGSGAASESQTLTVSATSSNPSLIPNPTVTYTSPNTTGTLSLSPAANGNGSAVISVTVNDGGTSNNTVVRTFTVTVNPVNVPPTLDSIANLAINENSGSQTVNLTGIGTGAANESQTLTVKASSSNPALIPNPAVTYTSPSTTGSLSFAPAVNGNGSAVISVTVDDNGTSNNTVVRTFTVTVNPVNVAPTLDPIANLTMGENSGAQTVNLTGIGTGAANETQTLTVTASSSNPGLIPNPTVNYTSPNSTGSLSLNPVVNGSGAVVISVTVNDGGTSNNTVVRTFTVMVNSVNVAPTLDAIADLAIEENSGSSTVNLAGIGSGAANESQTLTVTATSSDPSLIVNPTVIYTSPSATGSLSLTPTLNGRGSAVISVTANDGGSSNNTVVRSFTVTVKPVNVTPTLDPIGNLTINENAGAQTVSLTGISSGASNEMQTLTVTAISSDVSLIADPTVNYSTPSRTGSLNLSPALNRSGSAVISVTVDDGGASNNTVVRTFTVTVNAVSVPPTLDPIDDVSVDENSGAHTVNLTGISSGATNAGASVTVNALSSNPVLIPNPTVNYARPDSTGSLSFSPTANSYGSVTITVLVDNGAVSNNTVLRSFTVTVSPVNNPPTLNPIADLTISQNAGPQVVSLSGITSGATNEIQTITITATSSNPTLISDPTVTYSSPNTNATLTLAAVSNVVGSATIIVTVDDGQPTNSSAVRTFVVTVNPSSSGSDLLTNAIVAPNTTFRYQLSPPYNNGDRFTYSLGAGAPNGVKISSTHGTSYLTWKPTAAQSLTTNLITIVTTDVTNPLLSTNQTVLITVLDYLSLHLGSISVSAGQTGLLPIYLSSSSGVTNVSFTVDWPTNALTVPTLFVSAPGVASSSVVNQQTNFLISFQTGAGQVLQRSNLVGQLSFQVAASQSSGFVGVPVSSVAAAKPDGSAYVYYVPGAGQVAVVSTRPLLAPGVNDGTTRTLTAFGNVGASYQLQCATNGTGSPQWYPVLTYTQTNAAQTLMVSPNNAYVLYRLQGQ